MAEDKHLTLRDEIYARMAAKETEELVEIYQENDVEGRTEESLEIVRQILVERLGTLPEKEPGGDEEEDDEVTEEIAEEEHEFPQDKVLYRIADWSGRLSVWILTVSIISAILHLALSLSDWTFASFSDIAFPILSNLLAVLFGAFLCLVLQAITEIIYLLMDIRDLFQVTEGSGNISL